MIYFMSNLLVYSVIRCRSSEQFLEEIITCKNESNYQVSLLSFELQATCCHFLFSSFCIAFACSRVSLLLQCNCVRVNNS